MGPIIERHNGFIDKYIGDAIMALFSIVGNNGLDAAIAMTEELSLYNQRRITQGFVPIKIGIGLHTGRLILGTIGFEDRMDGTVISDAVNLASRLEGLTKYYGVNIIVSDALLLTLSDQSKYDFRRLDYVVVKGKSQPVLIYEILNGLPETTKQARLKTKDWFEIAVDLFIKKEYEQAALQFRNVIADDSTDSVAELYLQHCQQLGNLNIGAQS